MIARISIKDKLGSTPATPRQTEALLESFLAAKVDWILDFTGITQLTDSFVEGFFIKIVGLKGAKVFERKLTWVNLSHTLQIELHRKIQDALADLETAKS
jgi:hypothetical protein